MVVPLGRLPLEAVDVFDIRLLAWVLLDGLANGPIFTLVPDVF